MKTLATHLAHLRDVVNWAIGRAPTPPARGCSGACRAARPKWTLDNLPRGTHVELGGRVFRLGRLHPAWASLRAAEERRPDGTYSPETWLDLVSYSRSPFVVVSSRSLAAAPAAENGGTR